MSLSLELYVIFTIFTTLRLLNKKIVHKFIDLLYNDIEWRMI